MRNTFKILSSLLLILLIALPVILQAQSLKGRKSGDPFRNTQAFVGLWAGSNFSSVHVLEHYSEFVSLEINENVLQDEKEYSALVDNPAFQMGLSMAFSFNKSLTVAFNPGFRQLSYSYRSEFVWNDPENPLNYLENKYTHQQDLFYLSLPLLVRYSPLHKKFSPYLQAGAFYDRMLNAKKSVRTDGLDLASGGQITFSNVAQSSDISPLFVKTHVGITAGAGFTYNLGTVMLFMDGQYRYGLHNVSSAARRYSASRDLPGFGNVMDDLTLQNIEISLGCYFPLKFLTKDFSPVIL